MDDDLPLNALAKPKNKVHDDDMPLAFLGNKAKPGAGRPAAGRPSTGSKPGALVKTGSKRKQSSSSSSDSSSDSSDTSSESGGKKKAVGAKKKKLRLIQKKKGEAEGGTGEGEENNKTTQKERTPKEQVVVDLLCRWWYALPEWPPTEEAFYEPLLLKQSLRRVSIQEWEWVEDVEKGLAKVYELSQFPGVFRKGDGEMADLRPYDTIPSFQNFMKKDVNELYKLLVKAYEKQIEDLANSKYDEKSLRDSLTTALNRIRLKARNADEMAYATGTAPKKSV